MVSLLLGVAERPNPREIAGLPATPQPPSCNFIRYRRNMRLNKRPSTRLNSK
jgi:hypothetical protein